MGLLRFLRLSRLVFVLLALFLAWQVWVFMRPRPRAFTLPEQRAIDAVSRTFAELLGEHLDTPARVGLAHLLNDPNDTATAALRRALDRQPDCVLAEGSVIQTFLADVSRTIGNATTLDEVLNAGRRVGLDVVVAGRLLSVKELGQAATAQLDMRAYDIRSGTWIHEGLVTGTWEPGVATKMRNRIGRVPWFGRLLLWLSAVLLLPWITQPATLWAVARQSNLASFGLLAVYTAADLLLALALSGFNIQGLARSLLLIVALLASAAYNYWSCERIAARA